MAAPASRIEQFKKMAGDDPTNPVGHLSLGREYLTAGMFAEARSSSCFASVRPFMIDGKAA